MRRPAVCDGWPPAASRRLVAGRGAWLLVGGAVAWNLVSLRSETLAVAYLDDSSVHEQMVRFGTELPRAGRAAADQLVPVPG